MDDAAEGEGGDSTGCNTCTNGYIASEAFSNRRQLTYLYPRVRCILNFSDVTKTLRHPPPQPRAAPQPRSKLFLDPSRTCLDEIAQ